MRAKIDPVDNADLALACEPPGLLDTVRKGNATAVPTRQLNLFYVAADTLEKAIKSLKEKCRGTIIGRRQQGVAVGDKLQHREFRYETPQGEVVLQIQERITPRPDPHKLEALLKQKDLWQIALTTTVDPDKVDGLCQAGLITPEEMASISAPPQPVYVLIARVDKK